MVRIWARIVKNEKIVKETILENFAIFDPKDFFDYISTICESLDIATPVILSKHLSHYTIFNNCVFYPQDFPEHVSFDKMIVEEASNY